MKKKELERLKGKVEATLTELIKLVPRVARLEDGQVLQHIPRYVKTNMEDESTASSTYSPARVTTKDVVELILAKLGLELEVIPEKVVLMEKKK